MRIRVVLSGMVAAAFCILALWFPWYMIWPASVAPDWPYLNFAGTFPPWLETGVVIFCAFTLFTFGWISARWNWSRNWRASLLSGAGAGLIAGCLIYDLIGAFHYGLLGQEDLLKSFYTELTETKGLTLLVDAISGSAVYLYGNFLIVIALSAVLGAVGGLASAFDVEDVWGSPPRNPEGWLFRLPAYALTVTGAACMIVMIAVFSILQESVVKTAVDNKLFDLNIPAFIIPVFLFLATYLVGLVMTVFPLSITWGWAIRAWRSAGLWRVLYVIWVAVTLYLTADQLVKLFQYGSGFIYFTSGILPVSYMMMALLPVIIIVGLIIGWLSKPVIVPDSRYRTSDWLGYALTQGILGGTQLFVSVPAYALVASLIAIVNIPHLTQSGIVDQSPAQQIIFLSRMLTISAETSILICLLGGLLFGWIILLIRKFLKIAPVISHLDISVS